jgi:undecaprenyl-diphosphatase
MEASKVIGSAREWANDIGIRLIILFAAAVAISLLARFYEPLPGDVALIEWVQTWRHPAVTNFMEILSWIGKSWMLIGMTGVVLAGLYLTGRRQECTAAAWVLVILCLTPFLQILVDRSRPPANLVGIDDALGGLGFPSGHSYQSFIVFGFLIYLASILISRTWLRRSVQAFLVFMILGMGISRVYLGAHWPSDVLGGFLLGASFLALVLRGHQSKVLEEASR